MYSLTKEMALKIQELHIQYYAGRYPGGERALRAVLTGMTRADRLRSGIRYSFEHVNAHIPRAHAIHELCSAIRQRPH